MKIQVLNTVEENLDYLSTAQKEKVKKSRRICQSLGTPNNAYLKSMIRMNLIKHNEVSTEGANLAEKALRIDAGTIKSKTT